MKFRTYCLIALLCFAMFSGGCGGSSSKVRPGTDVNAVLNGAWRYSSGSVTADIGGDVRNMVVRDFILYFANSNVAGETGNAEFYAVIPLSMQTSVGEVLFPMVYDRTKAETTRIDSAEWIAETEHGNFTLTISDNTLTLNGNLKVYNIVANMDITLQKVTGETSQPADIDSAIDGTWWQASDSNASGGFVAWNDSILPGKTAFAGLVFEDTDIKAEKSKLTVSAFMETSGGLTLPMTFSDAAIEINHMFGNVYRIVVDENMKGVFVFTGEESAYIIVSSNNIAESHVLIQLTKKTGSDTVGLADKIGTTWEASSGAGTIKRGGSIVPLTMDNFTVSFPSYDPVEHKLTITAHGNFSANGNNVPVVYEGLELEIEDKGFNTWHAKSDKGSSFILSMPDDNEGILTADVLYDENTECTIIVRMQKK